MFAFVGAVHAIFHQAKMQDHIGFVSNEPKRKRKRGHSTTDMDQILPNFDPHSPRVNKNGLFPISIWTFISLFLLGLFFIIFIWTFFSFISLSYLDFCFLFLFELLNSFFHISWFNLWISSKFFILSNLSRWLTFFWPPPPSSFLNAPLYQLFNYSLHRKTVRFDMLRWECDHVFKTSMFTILRKNCKEKPQKYYPYLWVF